MPTPRLVLAAALVAVAAIATPAAHAAGPPLAGEPCTWGFLNDTTPGGQLGGQDVWTGVMFGGLVTAPGATVSIRCSLHVGNDWTVVHSSPAVVTETSLPGPGVATLDPRLGSYVAAITDVVRMCTEGIVDGTSWYLSPDGWTTDPDSTCAEGHDGEGLPPELRPLASALNCTLHFPECFYVPDICPVLVATAPGVPGVVDIRPDGDTYVAGEFVADCP